MVEQGAGPLSPLEAMFLLVVVATGILLGLVRGRRGSEASDPGGWSADDDASAGHCGADDGGSCDAH